MSKITRDSIFEIADLLKKKGKKVTNEAVKNENGGKGSFTTIAPIIREWKALQELEITKSEQVDFAKITALTLPFWVNMKKSFEDSFSEKEEKYIQEIKGLKEEIKRLKGM